MTDDKQIMLYFGDTESTINSSHISDYLGVFYNNYAGYYQPPISMSGLIALMRANPYHGTLVYFKANMLLKYLVTNPLISRQTIKRLAIDFNATANAYLQLVRNKFGVVIAVNHIAAANVRLMSINIKQYGYLHQGILTPFAVGEIWHWQQYSPEQELYGVPEWIGAIQSILLGESAVLFPCRFFANGAHTGNIISTSGLLPKEEDLLKERLRNGKGVGNFRTIHVGLPSGDIDKVIKVIPIGQATDIEYTKFRTQSKAEIFGAWRIRPELAGSMPENTGGSGDLEKIMMMNYENEIIPYQQDFLELNDELPSKYHVKFDDANGKTF